MTGSTSDSLMSAPPELGPHHPLGPAERDALRALQAAQDWPAAYRQIAIYSEQNKKITPQVANWLRTAADINQNIGPYAAYVRSEGVLAWARQGKVLTPEEFQKVSNELGESVVKHVLDYGLPERANDVLAHDVSKAVEKFQLKPSEWAGATANGLTSFDQIAPVRLNDFIQNTLGLPPSARVDLVLPLGDWGKWASSRFFDLPYVDIGLYEGSMFGVPPASGGKDGPATGNKTSENGTKITPDDAQWGAAGRWAHCVKAKPPTCKSNCRR